LINKKHKAANEFGSNTDMEVGTMETVDAHMQKSHLIQTEILKTRSFILVDSNESPVLELRAGDDNTLQIMDKYGNICTEIRIGQTPGKEFSSNRLRPH
jgi:hypothetical protein